MSKEGDRWKGRRGFGTMKGDGDEHAARAPGRVCVRLINQTLAFSVPAREKEEKSGIAGEEEEEEEEEKEEEMKKESGGNGGRRERGGNGCRPGRIEHEAESGKAKPGRTALFRAVLRN